MLICLLIHDLTMLDINGWGDQINNEIVGQAFGMFSFDKPGEFKDYGGPLVRHRHVTLHRWQKSTSRIA